MAGWLSPASTLLLETGRRAKARADRARADAVALERAIDQRRERYQLAAESCLADLTEQQLGFVCCTESLVAALCSRRAGKTFAVVRGLLAFALVVPKSRQIYINETRAEAKALVWDEPDDGFLAVLDRLKFVRGEKRKDFQRGADYIANETELLIRFANGSVIYLFGADNEKQGNKLRGRKCHRVVVDEAQKLPHIEGLIKRILGAAIKDLKGQIWLTGTPGIDCAGYFYEVTQTESTLPGWKVHRWSVRDNPFFGATAEERWARTAELAKLENGWDEDDPDFRREWGGEWVREDARYVIHVHKVPTHKLIFAPLRPTDTGQYDHGASLLDLPKRTNGSDYEWIFALGLDLGFNPDPTAIVLWAFHMESPDTWEMWSWKETGLHNDDRARVLRQILEQVAITVGVGDAGGLGKELIAELAGRYQLPLIAAQKEHKDARFETFNTEVRTARVHFRGKAGYVLSKETCSPLLWEAINLVYLPNVGGNAKPKINKYRKLPDKTAPGDHCIDAGIYSHHHVYAYRYEAPEDKPKPGTVEHDQKIEAQLEQAIDEEQTEQDDYYGSYQ